MRLLIALSFIISIVLVISCESTTETESPTPYMSLNVGDVSQYFREKDSLYIKGSIIGEATRTDGQKVYIGESEYNNFPDENRKSYYFIRDGYFYSTELDTTSEEDIKKTNPFWEQRLAKLFPEDGDKWLHTDRDVDRIYFVAKYEGEKSTPAKDFKNVYAFTLDTLMKIYYAEGYGHIGSSPINGNNELLLNYLKINGEEYGEYIPQDQLPKRAALKVEAIKGKYGIFGERLK